MLQSLLALALGYLAGSVPSGVIVTRLAGAEDPRGIGSRNIGATNVLRTGRKDLAALTLIADALKGTIAVLIAVHFDDGSAPIRLGVLAAFGAFFGHLFPLFLGFKGGKGVATFLGCLIGLAWPAAIIFAIVWLGVAFASRYSSAAALVASAATPFVLIGLGHRDEALLFALLAIVLWIKHRTNIERLMAGTEGRIGKKSGSAQ